MATASDNFNRADAGSLGANWTEFNSGFKIVTNRASPVNAVGNPQRAYYSALGTFSNDQFSAGVIAAGSGTRNYSAHVFVRTTGSGTAVSGYDIRWGDSIGGGTSVQINRWDTGTVTTLQTITGQTYNVGDEMSIEIAGNTIKARINGVQIGTDQIDSTYASGELGIGGDFDAYDVFDSWRGGDAGGGGGSTSRNLFFRRRR